jgi:hypothetical protein
LLLAHMQRYCIQSSRQSFDHLAAGDHIPIIIFGGANYSNRNGTGYADYMMGQVVDTYHDIQSKSIEFLRDIYSRADLRVRLKPTISKHEMVKETILQLYLAARGCQMPRVPDLRSSSNASKIFDSEIVGFDSQFSGCFD